MRPSAGPGTATRYTIFVPCLLLQSVSMQAIMKRTKCKMSCAALQPMRILSVPKNVTPTSDSNSPRAKTSLHNITTTGIARSHKVKCTPTFAPRQIERLSLWQARVIYWARCHTMDGMPYYNIIYLCMSCN
ncbi:hypothetical protein F5883DRAFT_554358 [Diaporthe sp. PMI_573]|nr:hypothetical protein F5883DRAFT_554358 [Diaporthaceae sp. PMI_573]